MNKGLIAIVGYKGTGKTTAADHLVAAHGFYKVKFAEPLKEMLRTMGLTERHLEGDLKEVPCDLLGGKTPRHAMQTLGTEWGRDIMDPDLWVRVWYEKVQFLIEDKCKVVVDDLRFPNELKALHALGGYIFLINSQLRIRQPKDDHASEKVMQLMDQEEYITLFNHGTVLDLKNDVDGVLLGKLPITRPNPFITEHDMARAS